MLKPNKALQPTPGRHSGLSKVDVSPTARCG
jgi:hypothetical protein